MNRSAAVSTRATEEVLGKTGVLVADSVRSGFGSRPLGEAAFRNTPFRGKG
jgi:hypothetical protein